MMDYEPTVGCNVRDYGGTSDEGHSKRGQTSKAPLYTHSNLKEKKGPPLYKRLGKVCPLKGWGFHCIAMD